MSRSTDATLPPRSPVTADEPANAVHTDRAAGPAGLLQVLEASGALLVAMVRTTPQVRAHHGFGVSDAEGFAAMGAVKTLVHTHDLAEGWVSSGARPPISAPECWPGCSRTPRKPVTPGSRCCGPPVAGHYRSALASPVGDGTDTSADKYRALAPTG